MAANSLQIELTVRLSDGSFDTKVSLPVEASDESRKACVLAWFDLILKALECGKEADAKQEVKP